MAEQITLYGATHCDDSERTRKHLKAAGIPFREVNIDHDPDAERFVIFINRGNRSTPTVVIGDGQIKVVVTEPSNEDLDGLLADAGHTPTISRY